MGRKGEEAALVLAVRNLCSFNYALIIIEHVRIVNAKPHIRSHTVTC